VLWRAEEGGRGGNGCLDIGLGSRRNRRRRRSLRIRRSSNKYTSTLTFSSGDTTTSNSPLRPFPLSFALLSFLVSPLGASGLRSGRGESLPRLAQPQIPAFSSSCTKGEAVPLRLLDFMLPFPVLILDGAADMEDEYRAVDPSESSSSHIPSVA
jgi:hypothetical protein